MLKLMQPLILFSLSHVPQEQLGRGYLDSELRKKRPLLEQVSQEAKARSDTLIMTQRLLAMAASNGSSCLESNHYQSYRSSSPTVIPEQKVDQYSSLGWRPLQLCEQNSV